jgi:phosphohistidine phosphatase SixA
MEFYLVRHGEAVSQAVNGQRPLTAEGRRDVERLGRATAQRGIQPSQIFHSGLLRAQQTAEILNESLGPVEGVCELVGLATHESPGFFSGRRRRRSGRGGVRSRQLARFSLRGLSLENPLETHAGNSVAQVDRRKRIV